MADGTERVDIKYKQNVISVNQSLEIEQPESNHARFVTRTDSVGNVLITVGEGSVIVNSNNGKLAVYIKVTGSTVHDGLCAEFNVSSNSLDAFDEWSKSPDRGDVCHLPFSVSAEKPAVASVCRHMIRLGNFEDCIKKLDIADTVLEQCEAHIANCENEQEPLACSCAFLNELSHRCTQSNIRVESWRTENFCPVKNCPNNMIWSENMDLCSSTCKNQRFAANDYAMGTSRCQPNFMSGCDCPVGSYLREDGQCVPKSECGCELHGSIYANGQLTKDNCQTCICNNHHWECSVQEKCAKSCSARGAGHLDTFDGVQMSHRTHGTYILARDDQSTIQIRAEFGPCELNEQSTCFHMADLNIKNSLIPRDVRFGPGSLVTVNTQSVMLPMVTQDLIIYQANQKIVVETKAHLRVEFEPSVGVTIFADDVWQEHLSGLCGNYNGKQGDELMTSLGFVGHMQKQFTSSWLIPGKGSFVPAELSSSSINHCNKKAFTKCNAILNLNKCSTVLSPETFITRCQEDVCNSFSSAVGQSIFCSYVDQYVSQCSDVLRTNQYKNWRKELNCLPVCDENEYYSEAYFPLEELCRAVVAPVNRLASGCACKSGYARDSSGKCVPRTQCPCYDDKGLIIMTAGEGNYQNGSFCKCSSGQIKCQARGEDSEDDMSKALSRSVRQLRKKQCKTGMKMMSLDAVQVCGRPTVDDFDPTATRCGCINGFYDVNSESCVPTEDDCSCDDSVRPKSTLCAEFRCKLGRWTEVKKPCPSECSIYGTEHIRTFDGRGFSFGGNCETVIATNQCTTNSSGPVFRISAVNQMCESSPDLVCSKHIKIDHEHGTYQVFGTTQDSGRRVINKSGIPPLHGVRHVGLYIIIQVSSEVTVMWDASLQIHVIAEQSTEGKLCGMCGNNNGIMDDDAQVRDGSSARSGIELGEGWKVSVDDQCQSADDFCLAHDQRKSSFAHENCKVLKSETFAACAEVVDVVPFHDNCLKSACSCSRGGDCECLCASIAAYARACALAGQAVRWRNENLCPLMCEDREAKPGG